MWPKLVSGFLCYVNRAHLVAGWNNDLTNGWLCANLDWQKIPKQKIVSIHEEWSQSQCSHFYFFVLFFMLFVICRLCVLAYVLHTLTTFGVDRLVFCMASWMYAMEGSAKCQDKKWAFGDGKLNLEIKT